MTELGNTLPFDSIHRHGFVRTAACVPTVRVVDPEANVEATIDLAGQDNEAKALVAVFPEPAYPASRRTI